MMNSSGWSGCGSARPSGAVLPLVLRRKRQEQQQQQQQGTEEEDGSFDLLSPPSFSAAASTVFSAQELEERIWRASVAMVDIQKQLARGEETYFEETNAHGNLYRGWDAFVDAKDVGLGGSAGSSGAPPSSGGGGGGGSRRIPADNRWFSGSCRSVSKNARPAPLYNLTSKSGGAPSTTPTPSMSARSESLSPFTPSSRKASTDVTSSKMKIHQNQENDAAVEVEAKTGSAVVKTEGPAGDSSPTSQTDVMEKSKETNKSTKAEKGDAEVVTKEKPKGDGGPQKKGEEEKDDQAAAEAVPEAPKARKKTRKRKAGD